MYHRLIVAVLLLAVPTACSTTHVVRLETGQGAPREYQPPSWNNSVRVGTNEFEQALARLVLEMPLALRSAQQGGLVLASYPAHGTDTRWQRLMGKSFGGLCKAGQRREDCLSLLDDVMGLSEWDKLGVALGLSFEPMRESISQAVENTLAPQLFYTVIATGLVTWVVLAANPEPVFTKAAAIVSALMLIYLGIETFLEVVKASLELKRATDKATTPEELEEAGQRFARRVGPQVARVLVLAVTVVVSQGMTGGAALLASRLSMLPGASEAAALGASQVGITLANVGQVSAVAVVDGNLAITLAPTAVAMAAMGPRGESPDVTGLPSGGPGEWVQVDESMPERARDYQAQVTGAPKGSAYRVTLKGEKVDFDGLQDGFLLEAKGPGYARFIDAEFSPKGFFTKGSNKLVGQARRQFKVAQGVPIRWVVAEEKFAAALRILFQEAGLPIEVISVPPIP
jgi:hypothetical protein